MLSAGCEHLDVLFTPLLCFRFIVVIQTIYTLYNTNINKVGINHTARKLENVL